MHPLSIEYQSLSALKPRPSNPRTHSEKQIAQIATAIQRFGFTNPILVDDSNSIVAGHGRADAARYIGLDQVPTVRLSAMSEAEIRAYVIADNKLAENAGWDRNLLALELQYLSDLGLDDLDVTITRFELPEIDVLIGELSASNNSSADEYRAGPGPSVSRQGDIWQIGDHRLVCGDSTKSETYRVLLGSEKAQMIFSDPPYNTRSPAMSADSVRFSIGSSPWPLARCRMPNLRRPKLSVRATSGLFRRWRHPFPVHRLAPYRRNA